MKIRLLALLMLSLLLLASCAAGGDDVVTTVPESGNAAAPVTDGSGETTKAEYDFPDVNYGNTEFRVFNSEQKYTMIMNTVSHDMTGEAVNDSIYENTCMIEEKFGVTMTETYGSFGGGMLTALQAEVMSGDPQHDVAYMYSTQVGSLISQNYLNNLYDYEEIDIDAAWWNQSLKADGSLFDKHLYYLVSDAHLMSFEGTWCIYFNMDRINDLGLDYPYDSVRNNEWTIEKLYTLAQAGASLNGDESYAWSAGGKCTYGLASFKNFMNALVVGENVMFCRKDTSDTPYYSLPTEQSLYEKFEAIAKITGEPGTYITANTTGMHYITDIFSQNRSLLMGGEIKAAANELNNIDFKFGIAPIPKYDEAQEGYHSNMLWSTLLMTIPVSVKDPSRAAVIMDALSYLAMDNTLPDYYDRVSYKGLADEDSIEMLNIISGTRYLNWGLTYNWLSSIEPAVNAQLDVGNAALSSYVKASEKIVSKLIEATLKRMKG